MMVWENRVMTVTTLPLRHRVPCCGYLFREKEPGLNVQKEAIEYYGLDPRQLAALKRGEDVELANGMSLPCDEVTYRPYEPRSYAYCSDTTPSGKVATLVHGVDLLYHEATFADSDKALARQTGHSTARQAATAALKAGAGRLLIGHFSSRYKDETVLVEEARKLFPQTEAAEEGKSYEIPLLKTKR